MCLYFYMDTNNNLKFITGNNNKFKHAQEVFAKLEQLNIDVVEIQSLDPQEVIEHKLNEVINLGYTNCFVEDVSFVIDKYGFPGPFIKWVNKTLGYDFGNYFEGENATVICLIGYCDEDKNIHFFEGRVKGIICRARGEDFGFNPLFIPKGHTQSYAEMDHKLKHSISHRAKALKKFQEFLENI